MMGKVVHGGRGAFSGEINYANDPKKHAKLIAHSDGVFTLNNSTIIDSLESHCGLNPRVSNPMTHLILGFSAQDSAKLTDQRMAEIAKDYLSRMGYEDTPFVIFRHHDKKHPHCHVIASRINNKGRTVKDSNERLRNIKVYKDITREYGLYMASGKENVKEDRLRKMDAVRYHVMHCVQESLAASGTWKEFSDKLAQVGISFLFRYNTDTHGIEGMSYTIDHTRCTVATLGHDVSFTGKKLDASLTLKKVCRQLGNPKTIAHESARKIYEQRKEDYQFHCTMEEFRHINEKYPDFDTLFAAQAKDAEAMFPSIEGDTEVLPADSSEPNIVTVGLEMLGVLIMQPYQAHISSGGGGSSSEQELEEIIKKTATVALQEHDDKVQEEGGFTFPHLYNRYLETKKANGSIISGFCHEYHPIIEQYQKIIEDQKAGEMEKYNKDITLSKSVDKLTEDLAPVIEENSITFWTFVRRRFTKWRKQSRWRNPFTYIYILIGLMYIAITVCPAVVNLDLKRTNKGAKAIIYEYLLVDMAMSGNEDYQEERLKINESVEKKGLYATWEETQELRPNFDNSISEPNRKE